MGPTDGKWGPVARDKEVRNAEFNIDEFHVDDDNQFIHTTTGRVFLESFKRRIRTAFFENYDVNETRNHP